jgi:hypothetical protein
MKLLSKVNRLLVRLGQQRCDFYLRASIKICVETFLHSDLCGLLVSRAPGCRPGPWSVSRLTTSGCSRLERSRTIRKSGS